MEYSEAEAEELKRNAEVMVWAIGTSSHFITIRGVKAYINAYGELFCFDGSGCLV